MTRGQLETRSTRLALAYAERGVRLDDLVTIALPNGEILCHSVPLASPMP